LELFVLQSPSSSQNPESAVLTEADEPKNDMPVPGYSPSVSFSKMEYVIPLKETAAQAPSNVFIFYFFILSCNLPLAADSTLGIYFNYNKTVCVRVGE
jgi:hypothetical protein